MIDPEKKKTPEQLRQAKYYNRRLQDLVDEVGLELNELTEVCLVANGTTAVTAVEYCLTLSAIEMQFHRLLVQKISDVGGEVCLEDIKNEEKDDGQQQ